MPRLLWSILLFLLPLAASAQTYETIRNSHPGAIETRVTAEHVYVYEGPDLNTALVGKFNEGKELLAYVQEGDFYAVASPARGHVGYVLLTALDVPQVPGAATAPRTLARRKDPGTARLMSIIVPGGGHIYAGQPVIGGSLLLGSVASVVIGDRLSDRTTRYVCKDAFDNCGMQTDYDALKIGAAVAAGLWGLGILTSGAAVRSHNRKLVAQAAVVPAADGRMLFAVRVRW